MCDEEKEEITIESLSEDIKEIKALLVKLSGIGDDPPPG